MKKNILPFIFIITMFSANQLAAQTGIAINSDGSAADASAMLDVKATDKGMLVPRMTHAQKILIATPATGLMIYQTDGTPGFYFNSGTSGTPVWTPVSNPITTLETSILENSFTPNTAVYHLRTGARTQLTTVGTLNAATNLLYTSSGVTITKIEAVASANANADHVFTLIVTTGPFVTAYSNTTLTCTMVNGTSSCSSTGNIVIPPGSLFGICEFYGTTTPAGFTVRMALSAR
jgi:hypothetical protein